MFVRTLLPRMSRCYLSDTADWQAHFLGLRVQKNISRLALITSQPSLANSAHLLRVIGFAHLFLKVNVPSPMWYIFLELKSSSLHLLL